MIFNDGALSLYRQEVAMNNLPMKVDITFCGMAITLQLTSFDTF